MDGQEDKQWAAKYLLDPLNAPEPSQETGPGVSHVHDTSMPPPPRKPVGSGPGRSASSASSTQRHSRRSSSDRASTLVPVSTSGVPSTTTTSSGRNTPTSSTVANEKPHTHRRNSSLEERFPGDLSHRPLDMLRASDKMAHRAPHLRKKHLPPADSVDILDESCDGVAYHHGGPYDATLWVRNTSARIAPLSAVRETNIEALKATAREHVQNCLDRHVPLDGVAALPSGTADRYGRVLHYKSGEDMMIAGNPEGGSFRRWPGIQYHPNDLKGKGEPSYSLEKALKTHRRNVSEPYKGAHKMTTLSERHPPGTRIFSDSPQNSPESIRARTARRNTDAYRYNKSYDHSTQLSGTTGRKDAESGDAGLRRRMGDMKV